MAEYSLTIDLSTLNHLGVNLYSSVPAVLSEAVANAWDADAKTVDITIRNGTITITDDGHGMTKEDCNKRYLTIGYERRSADGPTSPGGRKVMGRKGIGKLSLFSIAKTIEIHTAKKGGRGKAGFKMDLDKITERIAGAGKSGAACPLESIPESRIRIRQGTMIRLTNLKKHVSEDSKTVRKKIARRFSIIGAGKKFSVKINGTPISTADRDYFTSLEYVWYMGVEGEKMIAKCKCEKNELSGEVDSAKEYAVSGWIGTAREQKHIDDDNNKITVIARGKIIHEDILGDIKVGGIYSKYLIGEIQADFLDYDELDDIATTNRQRVVEYDERYFLLREYVRTAILQKIQQKWTELRTKDAKAKALRDPQIKKWFDSIGPGNKKYALSLFRKIEAMKGMDKDTRIELYKTHIVGFHTLAVHGRLAELERLEDDNGLETLLAIIGDMDELEALHYYDITKSRLKVLEKFEDLVDSDAREKALQKYLFKHLWLLDHSWESTKTDRRIEKSFRSECKKIDRHFLTDDEKNVRTDIRYVTSAGKHIIVELKRRSRRVDIHDLSKQVSKYDKILGDILRRKNPNAVPQIEIVCVLGSDPLPDHDAGKNQAHLRLYNARYVTYESLISHAKNAYAEYLEQKDEIRGIQEIIDKISLPDTPAPRRNTRTKRATGTAVRKKGKNLERST